MTFKIAMLVIAMSQMGATSAAAAPRFADAAGVRLEWFIKDAQVHACMQAATRGWGTVGFNTLPRLEGARLVMGRVVNGRAETQVHIAKPPEHIHRLTREGAERVSHVTGSQSARLTRICFRMPLAAADQEDVNLQAGQDTHIILAWSHESDFHHHSAQRGAMQVKL